ncbi:hypothetical protein BKA62DRAFT_688418 [Auriculariales sp. MPI-PUGE-AT-0066]|nr:hypothetical protein BKA62DRAFT_688418 [Auriculariales sp. MPI-PUGE-AT-0066]
MKGWPWYASGSETVTTRVLLLQVLDLLAAYGYELHATVDMCYGSEGIDVDTWFLRKYTN